MVGEPVLGAPAPKAVRILRAFELFVTRAEKPCHFRLHDGIE